MAESENTTSRRDLIAIETVLQLNPVLFVNTIRQPHIMLPLLADESDRESWSLRHDRVKAELARLVYELKDLVLFDQELNRILNVLEGRAWLTHREEISTEQAFDESPLIEAAFIFLKQPEQAGSFHGSASKLLHLLNQTARKCAIETTGYSWPQGAAQLSRQLFQQIVVLERLGIHIERGRESGGYRYISLTSVFAESCDDADIPSPQVSSREKTLDVTVLATDDDADRRSNSIFERISISRKECSNAENLKRKK